MPTLAWACSSGFQHVHASVDMAPITPGLSVDTALETLPSSPLFPSCTKKRVPRPFLAAYAAASRAAVVSVWATGNVRIAGASLSSMVASLVVDESATASNGSIRTAHWAKASSG